MLYAKLAAFAAVAAAAPAADITAACRSCLSSGAQIFVPQDANYDTEVTPRWTSYGAPSYRAVVQPANDADVQCAVRTAQQYNISFMATGGGHGYTTSYAALKDGISIQLEPAYQHADVDAEAKTLTIGGGTRFRDTVQKVQEAGLELQIGSGTCVGMVGATVGAGVGRYQGLYGLIIDALQSVKVLVASGDILTASTTENSDLFWALRGAGANFGIILEATYGLHPQTNGGKYLNADFRFAASQNESVWNAMKKLNDMPMPAAASIFQIMNHNESFGGANIIINAVYIGSEEEGRDVFADFFAMPNLQQNISMVTYSTLGPTSLFGLDAAFCVEGLLHNSYALGVKDFDVPTYVQHTNDMVQFWSDNPLAINSTFEIELFATQAVLAVPDDATAYPYRDSQAQILMTFDYAQNLTHSQTDDNVNAFAKASRDKFGATSGFTDGLHVYTSYAHGDEGIVAQYAERKLPRLNDLKAKWDPNNVFRFNNPIVPQ